MKLHHRIAIVSRARLDIETAVARIVERDNLTVIETIGVLQELAAHQVRLVLRFERHGTYDKKADEA